ncbi:MarR family transcriptional regulator [Rhodococcus sp. EPR-157]|uniref:MarR family transcriptional regulator n=1 Tax=Rhodococcus sp. EPR-157 TaxID=1813677 RepID=UPI0007BC2F4F|nr:MarR family transcriptional regulator [Rhodococcus sp. EPR-157]KZF09816.1 MarR family transcriptional regulator [Rhodococcus sp. EPR-157]
MEITIDAVGSAPAGAVWERYMNPQQWSSWATQIVGVEYSEERLTAGTFGRVEGPLWIHVDFEILDVDESEWMWTWSAWWKRRSVGLTLTHGVASRTDGSRTWLRVSGSPALIIPYLPVAKFALMRLVRR